MMKMLILVSKKKNPQIRPFRSIVQVKINKCRIKKKKYILPKMVNAYGFENDQKRTNNEKVKKTKKKINYVVRKTKMVKRKEKKTKIRVVKKRKKTKKQNV